MRFPGPVVLLLALLHVYIGVRLLLPFGAVTQVVGALLLALCFVLLPKGFRIRDDRGPWAVMLPWLTMGFFSWLLVLTLLRDVSLIASALALSQEAHESWIRNPLGRNQKHTASKAPPTSWMTVSNGRSSRTPI